MELTCEQLELVRGILRISSNQCLKTIAYAGTGKTSTLAESARKRPDARILYLVYNRDMAREARQRFPANAVCRTAHALAWHAMGHPSNLTRRPLRGDDVADALGFPAMVNWGHQRLSSGQAGVAVLETIRRFWRSADPGIQTGHAWYGPLELTDVVTVSLIENARRLWGLMQDGCVPIEHDAYLKHYQLALADGRRAAPDVDLVFFDEAQDANPVLQAIIASIRGAARVFVGDPYQQIYAWQGAVNALDRIEGEEFALTISHRFGPLVAEYATHLLSFHSRAPGDPVRSSGVVKTRLGVFRDNDPMDAILCRTRAGVLEQAIRQQVQGRGVYVVGGPDALSVYLRDLAMIALGCTERVRHRDLIGIETWAEALNLAEQNHDQELAAGTRLVEEFGARAILDALEALRSEDSARPGDIAISTVHRAKGREWDRVALADDLCGPADLLDARGRGLENDEEIDIAYVAATRAKKLLLFPESHFRPLPHWERQTRPSSPIDRALRSPY